MTDKRRPWYAYGNYVGPYWSAGARQESVVSNLPPIDEYDATAQEHDAIYASNGDLRSADFNYFSQNIIPGIRDTIGATVTGDLEGVYNGLHRTIGSVLVGGQGLFQDYPDSAMPSFRGKKRKRKGSHIGREQVRLRVEEPESFYYMNPEQIPLPDNGDDWWDMTDDEFCYLDSFNDLPSDETMPTVLTKGPDATNGTNAEEVPVMPVPRNLAKVVPNYFTINCPWESTFYLNPTTYTETNSVVPLRVRLNSVYDPVVGATSNTQPQGRDLWASHFKYYRVLQSEVVVTLINCVPTTFTLDPFYNSFVWGYELLDQDSTVCASRGAFLVSKHCKRAFISSAPGFHYWNGAAVVNGTQQNVSRTLSYTYHPEKWNYHVREVGSEERWTPIRQNPSVDHDLAIRLFHLDSLSPATSDTRGMGILISVNYTVQFMEEDESQYKVRDSTPATYGGAGEDAVDD